MAVFTYQAAGDEVSLRLAVRDLMETHGTRYPQGPEYLRRLEDLAGQLRQPAAAAKAGADLLVLEREALLANPLLDFDRLFVLKRGFPSPRTPAMRWGRARGRHAQRPYQRRHAAPGPLE